MPNVAMKHDTDPREALLEKLGDAVDKLDVGDNRVIVATYLRPQRTYGGIILTQRTLDEDKFQSKIGLVLKIGPSAEFPTLDIKVHDWVVVRPSDGFAFEILNGREQIPCRWFIDRDIRGKTSNPDLVW
jgi:co-chaperonin GroES (HSP10)